MNTLLIGQSPGANSNPELPLFPVPRSSAGGRLVDIMGIPRGQYLKHFDRANLIPYFPGRTGRDDKFPMAPARLAAQALRPLLVGRAVVLVGRNVARAFGLEQMEFHYWQEISVARPCLAKRCQGMATIAVVPHPSGRNLWYNDPERRLEANQFWRNHLEDRGLSLSAKERITA